MPRLVALDIAPGPGYVEQLRTIWDDGDAVLPLDVRTTPAARLATARAARAAIVRTVGAPDVELVDPLPTLEGDAVVVATSGTAAEPRFAVHTHAGITAASRASAVHLGLDGDEHWLGCLPLAHVGGLSVVTRALHTAARLTLHPSFDATAVETAGRAGASHVSLVATALRRIDGSVFRCILLGGDAAPSGLPDNVVTTYGMTETFGGVVYDGRILDGTSVRIVDGEILLRGPSLLRAWRDGTEPLDDAGWLHTGDLGALDDGNLTVTGRIDDIVVTGGEKVEPRSVERAIAEISSVLDVAVAGLPDEEWGQRVVAWVVPRAGEQPLLEDVRAAVRAVLPPWFAPREIRIVETIPRTALGKIRRAELRRGISPRR